MGILGRYLASLSPEQEDRVRTAELKRGSYDGPCLKGCVVSGLKELIGTPSPSADVRVYWHQGNTDIETAFDYGFYFHGGERFVATLRNRILRNRLRRAL